jgi:hypothetical protein
VFWVDHPGSDGEWCGWAANVCRVQGGDCCAPRLADLGQLGDSAALLNKISATELAFVRDEFGRCRHCNLPNSLVLNGASRQGPSHDQRTPPDR